MPEAKPEPTINVRALGPDGKIALRPISLGDLERGLEYGPHREGGTTARIVLDGQGKPKLAL